MSTSIMLRLISMFVVAFNGAEAYRYPDLESQKLKGNTKENLVAFFELGTPDTTKKPDTPPATTGSTAKAAGALLELGTDDTTKKPDTPATTGSTAKAAGAFLELGRLLRLR